MRLTKALLIKSKKPLAIVNATMLYQAAGARGVGCGRPASSHVDVGGELTNAEVTKWQKDQDFVSLQLQEIVPI